jgi:SAM-dependent methyltransferase
MSHAGDKAATCPQECRLAPCFADIDTCPVCGLGRTSYAAPPPIQRNYLGVDAAGVKLGRPRRLFDEFLRDMKVGSLLDIGCSDGALLDVAAAAGWRVQGIDPQPNPSERIIGVDFLSHRFAERFDALTMIHSFEHMADPQATLRKCRSLLNPGGRLLIVVPNFGGWWARIMGADWQWLNVDDHRYHYTRRALSQFLNQGGFHIEACSTASTFAPSLPEMLLSAKRVFEWPLVRWPVARSLVYRLSRAAGVVCNPIADAAGQGAELQVLACLDVRSE